MFCSLCHKDDNRNPVTPSMSPHKVLAVCREYKCRSCLIEEDPVKWQEELSRRDNEKFQKKSGGVQAHDWSSLSKRGIYVH